MSKMVALLCLLPVMVILPSYSAFATSISGDMTYQERQQVFSQMHLSPNAVSTNNYFIQILKTPAGAEMDNFVINGTDLVKIQNNVGIFTVCGSINNGLCGPPLPTQALPTNNYCQMAILIHFNEDGYDNFKVGNSTIFQVTTPPAYCSTTPVPEFSTMASIVLAVSVLGIVMISSHRLRK